MTAAEQRRSPRVEGVTFPVEYSTEAHAQTIKRARAVSIGEAGFMILLEESYPMGTPLYLKLYLPKTFFPFSNWQAIRLETQIVRVDSQVGQDGYFRHGLLITQIPEEEGIALKRYVQLAHWIKDRVNPL
ncbi:MAG: PilZ domain-containing protein [Nitrospirae bacterium]|nr:PilZ domain-containing protein [Candidatus Manganitrophaceae bacterium]